MAVYLVGDIQGCDDALARLLAAIDFSASRDCLYVLGDMVNRGPDSAATLRRLMRMGASAQCILGNHDLHLLAIDAGLRKTKGLDTVEPILSIVAANSRLIVSGKTASPAAIEHTKFCNKLESFVSDCYGRSVRPASEAEARMAAQLGLCATGQVPDRLRVAMAKARTAVELTAPTQVFADLARQNSGAALGPAEAMAAEEEVCDDLRERLKTCTSHRPP